jgi:hypothetical protein
MGTSRILSGPWRTSGRHLSPGMALERQPIISRLRA